MILMFGGLFFYFFVYVKLVILYNDKNIEYIGLFYVFIWLWGKYEDFFFKKLYFFEGNFFIFWIFK